jgi:Ca-activated chloride channel family protein
MNVGSLQFASPWLLVLLLLVPVLAVYLRRRRPPLAVVRFAAVGRLQGIPPGWRVRRRWLAAGLRLLALVLVILALARPQRGRASAEIPSTGIDMALVLDVSGSMSANKLGTGSRLDVAKQVLNDFIRDREGDRMGLVAFRSRSLMLSPLTLDKEALHDAINLISESYPPSTLLNDGTAIGLGLGEALNMLRESRAKSRIVILLTDGANNVPDVPPLQAARLAQTLQVRVYTIGVLEPPQRGQRTASDIDEQSLQEIANTTGGKYYRATSAETLRQIYQEISNLEKSNVGVERFTVFDELAPYLLAAAFALLLGEVGLSYLVFRRIP